MGIRVGLVFFFVLGMTLACDARKMVASESSEFSGEATHNDNVCALCDKYVTLAFDYLEDNTTQAEIIDALHMTCSHIPSLKKQCLAMADYYAQLFFTKLSLIEPNEICKKFDLCEAVAALASEAHQGSCEACHETVSEVIDKLKDPETKLKIIRILLKECKSLSNYQDKCKKMVFEYGPMILANVEKFLEKTDVCAILHACPPSISPSQGSLDVPVLAVADS